MPKNYGFPDAFREEKGQELNRQVTIFIEVNEKMTGRNCQLPVIP